MKTKWTTWVPGPKFWAALAAFLGVVSGLYSDVKWLTALSAGLGAVAVYFLPPNSVPYMVPGPSPKERG